MCEMSLAPLGMQWWGLEDNHSAGPCGKRCCISPLEPDSKCLLVRVSLPITLIVSSLEEWNRISAWGAAIVVQWVKPWLGVPASYIGVLILLFPAQFLAEIPKRQQMVAQILGPLSPTWESQMDFLAPGFGLTQSQLS